MRVSVIINNYNYEVYLRQAIDSALRQSHSDLQVIAVDDGSQDGSLAVMREYGDAITIIEKPNGGQASAYRAGFDRADGEIIIFLDADDWLYPTAIAEIVASWRPDTSKAQFRLELVDAHGEALSRYVPRAMHGGQEALNLLCQFGAYGSPPGSGNAYSAAFLRQLLPLDEERWRTAADTVPILLAPLYGDVVSLLRILGAYRLHRGHTGDHFLPNNAPKGLQQEFQRITFTKQYIQSALAQRQLPSRLPLLFAPWECRIAAMYLRFSLRQEGHDTESNGKLRQAIFLSVWCWPDWPLARKFLLSGWTALLLILPHAAARRLALRHRTSIGARGS